MENQTKNSRRMLLVDDDEMMLSAVADFFETRGHQVDTTKTPTEAVLAIRDREYDVVISDLHFTTENHLEGLGFVAELAKTKDSPRVFVLSGDRTWEVAKDHRMKRIAAYIPKLIGLDALVSIIENAMNTTVN